MQAQQQRPQVTLTASSLPGAPEQPARELPSRRLPSALLLLPVLALAVALAPGHSAPEAVPVPAAIDAELLLLDERLSSSQTGILVLPVELQNRGGALKVQRAEPYGFPLRAEPSVQVPQDVGAGERRRFVVVVAPECELLDGGSGELFVASLLVHVVSGPESRNLVLDLSASELVRERVASLCA